MMRSALLAASAFCAAASLASAADAKISCVPLFETASVYVDYGDAKPASCELFFKRPGDSEWLKAYPPVDVKADCQFRGSVVKLSEDSAYDVRAELKDAAGAALGSASSSFKTWSSNPPVGKTVEIGGGPLKLKGVNGSPDAWIKYVAKHGASINGGDAEESAILVESCSYLIFEGLKVQGGRKHGFNVKDSKYVRIVNCEISGWGRIGKQDFSRHKPGDRDYGKFFDEVEKRTINNDAAVFDNLSQGLVVERCFAHDPRGTANSWRFAHPEGPNAVFVRAAGETVIRWNDFIGSDLHRWNDVIEGYNNGFKDGGFNKDAGIYGNFLAFGNDDGIELDGGQMNVSFYGNKVEGTLCGVSTAPNMRGPSYIFENLVVNLADEDGKAGSVVKNGGGAEYSHGISFFFNNTFYTRGHGICGVGYGNAEDRSVFKGLSRNNAMVCDGSPLRVRPGCADNDFNFDLLSRRSQASGKAGEKLASPGTEASGIFAAPSFKDAKGGDFALLPGSRGLGEAQFIPNFSGANPAAKRDLGAVQSSNPRMMPMRPLGVDWSKGQINFNVSLGKASSASETMEFSAKPGAKLPLKFAVLKPDAASFFDVEPKAGQLGSSSQKLKISLVPGELKKPGLFKGAFIVKFENGFSFPVSVYAKCPSDTPDIVIPIESFSNVPQGKLQAAEGSSSAKALLLDGGDADKAGSFFIEADISVPEGEPRFLSAKAKAPVQPAVEHDSLFISVDGAEPVKIDLVSSMDWALSPLTFAKDGQSTLIKPGTHKVRIYPRESIIFDALVLNVNPRMDAAD